MKLKVEWIGGNRVQLLENGDTYFPAVFDAIDAAEREVLIETFILFEDRCRSRLAATFDRCRHAWCRG